MAHVVKTGFTFSDSLHFSIPARRTSPNQRVWSYSILSDLMVDESDVNSFATQVGGT